MSLASETVAGPPANAGRLRRDTLSGSVVVLIAFSCVQPLVTFLRGFLFCRWLEPAELGCWDLALGFLTLAAPVVVLGIPGSFGRYVENYSRRGQLGVFLRRTGLMCVALATTAITAVAVAAPWCSYLIFGRADMGPLVRMIAVCLGSMIAFGFVVELLTALRMFRVVSLLQFAKGLSFALVGAGLLVVWARGPESLVAAYTIACLGAVAIALVWLIPLWRGLPAASGSAHEAEVPRAAFWARLMPFAVWVWFTNVLCNLFEIVDRYMIVHFSNMSADEALVQVGHYHSSRILPMLLVTFTGMLASIMLPHLVKDWEAGRRRVVSARMVLGLKLCGLALSTGATLVLLISPWLFNVGFQGKYHGGLAVLPWTLVYCAWFGMVSLGEMYLWCAERARLASSALAVGLAVNIVLNLLLLPYLGLLGAVLATAGSKLVVLALIYAYSHALGMQRDVRLWAITLLPLSVCLGALTAAGILAVVGLAAVATQLVLTAGEKRELAAVLAPAWQRWMGRRAMSPWQAPSA